jgi:hypothetical protein
LVEERPDDAEVDRELMPLEVEVESEETLLFVVERPEDAEVESEETLLFVVDRPDDAEVDSEPM